jgi:hypothetical protein
MPKLAWKPCENGVAGCQQLVVDWMTDGSPVPFSVYFGVTHDSGGIPNLLFFTRFFNYGRDPVEIDIYGLSPGRPLLAFRMKDTAAVNRCLLTALAGESSIVAYGRGAAGTWSYSSVFAKSLGDGFRFHPLGSDFLFDHSTTGRSTTSDSTFTIELVDGITRTQLPDGDTAVISSFAMDFNEGDTIFAIRAVGQAGQEWVLPTSASPALMRGPPDTDVDGFRSDGTSLAWIEGTGAGPDGLPTNKTLWTAPFTTDPATLATSAHKVTDLAVGDKWAAGVYFNGLLNGIYATGNGAGELIAVRLADGARTKVLPGPGWMFRIVGPMYPTEVWGLMSQSGGPDGIALARYTMSW